AGEQRSDRLRLRIAEAAVELEHARTLRGQHQPRIEQAHERSATARELSENGTMYRRNELVARQGRQGRPRCTPSHPTCVRPLVTIECALEVLGGDEWERLDSVADREERDLRPLEQ